MSVLDTAEYRRLALLAAGVDPSQIPAILDTATWRRLMIAALVAISEGGGGGGAGYVNGSVQFYADLPVTVGTPPVNTAYLVREDSGVWFINRKPAGIYVRLFNNGTLADWDYAGEFPSVNDSQYFRIYDTADPTKELAFDVSGISSGTTRTLDAPNRDGRIAVSDYRLLSANANAVTGDKVAADTTAGAFTLTLPATPSNGDTVTVLDYAGTFDTNNLTIARNGSNIESLAENMTCEVEDAAFTLVYVGSTVGWKVVPYFGNGGKSDFNDADFRLFDNGDSSKNLAFQLSGISAGQTCTLTVPDSSGTIALSNQVFDFYYATAPAGATGGSGSVWTFTIPSWSNHQLITMIGAGGGGGSGRVGASGTVNAGGGGGGSGAFGFFATRITGGSVIEVSVGAGGAGGAAVTASNQNGNAGTTGGDVRVRWVTPNITLRHGSTFGAGGGGGGGGNNTLGTSGTAGASAGATILGTGGNGAGGTAGSLTGTPGGGSNNNTTQGGRAGGSIDATPTAYNGGSIGGSPFTDVRAALYLPDLSPAIGTGARGGNASTTANAQDGANAGGLGGGGGGGGAALNGFNSGAGGNGGDGFVRIVCF